MTYCAPGGQPGGVAVEALEEGADSGSIEWTDEYTFRDDGFRRVFLLNWSVKARQCVCFDILMAWIIRDGEIEASKE